MKQIRVYRLSNGYVARFINSPEVVELMGFDVIPTAFTEKAAPEYVKAKLTALNPGHDVEVFEGLSIEEIEQGLYSTIL